MIKVCNMVVISNITTYQVIALRSIKSAVYPNKELVKSQQGHIKENLLIGIASSPPQW